MDPLIVEDMKHLKYTIKYQEKTLTIRLRPQDKADEPLVRESLLLIRDTLVNKTSAVGAVKFWGQNNFVLIAFTFWDSITIEYFKHLSDEYVAKRFFNDSPERSREFIEFIENTLGIRSFYENKHPEIRNRIKDIYYQSYRREGIRNIANCMKKRQTLVEMVNIMGIHEVIRISFQELPETTTEYIMHFAGLYTSRHEKVTYPIVMREIFGKRMDVNVKHGVDINTYIYKIKELVHSEYLLELKPKTLVQKQKYVLDEQENSKNPYVMFGGRILNMEEQLEKRLLKSIRAHRIRGGICGDITACKSDMWNCLDCKHFIPDREQLPYFREQVLAWQTKAEKFKDYPMIKTNAMRNAELFEKIVKKLMESRDYHA